MAASRGARRPAVGWWCWSARLALILLLAGALAGVAVASVMSGPGAVPAREHAGPSGRASMVGTHRLRRSAVGSVLTPAGAHVLPPPPATAQSMTFWLAWSGQLRESRIPWNAVTQVDLFALMTRTRTHGCSSDCTRLDTYQTGISRMNVRAWVATIHRHGKLAVISIGGSSDQDWANACARRNRPGFAARLVHYMVSHGFDGLDLDIESLAGSGRQLTLWATCVRALTRAAHRARTRAGAVPLVSTDVDQSWMDHAVARFARWPDQFNLMYYGYPTGSYNCAHGCAAVNALLGALHRVGRVPYDRMMLGMSPGGRQAQCCYVTLGATRARVDTRTAVRSISLSSGLATALPAGRVVLAGRRNPPSRYAIFTTPGAAQGARSIPVRGEVAAGGGATFAPGSAVQSDTAGPWDCGNFARDAAAHGLKGMMVWDLQEEAAEHHGRFPCFAQIAPYVSTTPSAAP